jgi:DNA polymerase III delta subunit
MFLLLHGPDRLRIREKEADLRTKFIEKHDPAGMNTDVVSITDGSEKEMQILGEVLASAPFMATMRMIIVRNALSTIKKANLEDWKRLFTHTQNNSLRHERILLLLFQESLILRDPRPLRNPVRYVTGTCIES